MAFATAVLGGAAVGAVGNVIGAAISSKNNARAEEHIADDQKQEGEYIAGLRRDELKDQIGVESAKTADDFRAEEEQIDEENQGLADSTEIGRDTIQERAREFNSTIASRSETERIRAAEEDKESARNFQLGAFSSELQNKEEDIKQAEIESLSSGEQFTPVDLQESEHIALREEALTGQNRGKRGLEDADNQISRSKTAKIVFD